MTAVLDQAESIETSEAPLRSEPWTVRGPSLRDPRLRVTAVLLVIHLLGQVVVHWELSIAQLLLSIGVCGVIELVHTAIRDKAIVWPSSAMQTGNSVALLLRVPGTVHGDWWSLHGWWVFVGCVVLSVVTKFVIRSRGVHVFNPSNVGLVLFFLVLGTRWTEPQDLWWGPLSPGIVLIYAVLIGGGIWITRPLRLLGMGASFIATFAVATAVIAATGHSVTARWHYGPVEGLTYWSALALSPETLIFLFFMITDPKTTPRSPRYRAWFGVVVALIAAILIAGQTTEFATKVSLLASLTLVCVVRSIAKAIDLPRRLAGLHLPTSLPRRVGVAGLAVASIATSLIVVSTATRVDTASASSGRDLPPGAMPTVTIDEAVQQKVSGFGRADAEAMVAGVVIGLEAEAEAIREHDATLAEDALGTDRFARLRSTIGDLRRGDPVVVPTYRFERAAIAIVGGRSGPQTLPRLGVVASGTVEQVTWVGGRERERTEPEPFEATFVVEARSGGFVLAGDDASGALPEVEVPTIPLADVLGDASYGTAIDEGSQAGQLPLFEDVTDAAGVRFDTGTLAVDALPEPAPGYWDTASAFDVLNGSEEYYASGNAWGDVDGDGVLDLFLTDQTGSNRLFLGRGDGTFAPAPGALADPVALEGAGSGSAQFVDYDNSGRRSLLVLTATGPHLFRNVDGRRFEEVTEAAGIDDDGKGETASWADFDADGDLDLFLANYGCQPCSVDNRPPYDLGRNRLYRNDGDGTFTDLTSVLDRFDAMHALSFAGAWIDYDDDGRPDLLLANDVRSMTDALVYAPEGDRAPSNVLLRNEGPGCDGWCFRDVTTEAGADQVGGFMSATVGDFSGSGRPDAFFTNTGFIGGATALIENRDGRYQDVSLERGANLGEWSWGSSPIDVDNDGRLDLFVSVGYSDLLYMLPTTRLADAQRTPDAVRDAIRGGRTEVPPAAYQAPFPVAADSQPRTDNNRVLLQGDDGRFRVELVGDTDAAVPPHYTNAVADFDDDGWPDVISGSLGSGYSLIRNRGRVGAGNHRVTVVLAGDGARVNRDAVGARVRVTDSAGRVHTGWVQLGGGLGGGSDLAVHLGLGVATAVRAEVRWPDGTTTTIADLRTDGTTTVTYGGDTTSWRPYRTVG